MKNSKDERRAAMRNNFFIIFVVLVLVQTVICNYCSLSPYLMLSILPVLIFCMPTRIGTTAAMFIAFGVGLAVDLLAEGVIGLNIIALVPVAYVRRRVYGFVFGEELLERNDDFVFNSSTLSKVIFGLTLVQSLFLVIYILSDGSAVRTAGFCALRFGVSLVFGVLLSLAVAHILTKHDKR